MWKIFFLWRRLFEKIQPEKTWKFSSIACIFGVCFLSFEPNLDSGKKCSIYGDLMRQATCSISGSHRVWMKIYCRIKNTGWTGGKISKRHQISDMFCAGFCRDFFCTKMWRKCSTKYTFYFFMRFQDYTKIGEKQGKTRAL